MDKVVMKGRTVEEAKKAALEVLGGKEEEVEFRVLKEGKGGVLGVFGVEEAEVEAWRKGSQADFAKDFLQGLLDRMRFMALVSVKREGEEGVELNIRGEDMGRIIGKEGAALDALQLLVGLAASKRAGARTRVVVDAEGYREKQRGRLERLAREKAEEVKKTGKEALLPPLSAAERRVIHEYLQKDPLVHTYSEGSGEQRRLIIAPGGPDPASAPSGSR